jgi:hypothetical protein
VSGTIQLPPDGNPLILLAEHQTTGGYKVPGVVIQADLWKVKPCDRCCFDWNISTAGWVFLLVFSGLFKLTGHVLAGIIGLTG